MNNHEEDSGTTPYSRDLLLLPLASLFDGDCAEELRMMPQDLIWLIVSLLHVLDEFHFTLTLQERFQDDLDIGPNRNMPCPVPWDSKTVVSYDINLNATTYHLSHVAPDNEALSDPNWTCSVWTHNLCYSTQPREVFSFRGDMMISELEDELFKRCGSNKIRDQWSLFCPNSLKNPNGCFLASDRAVRYYFGRENESGTNSKNSKPSSNRSIPRTILNPIALVYKRFHRPIRLYIAQYDQTTAIMINEKLSALAIVAEILRKFAIEEPLLEAYGLFLRRKRGIWINLGLPLFKQGICATSEDTFELWETRKFVES